MASPSIMPPNPKGVAEMNRWREWTDWVVAKANEATLREINLREQAEAVCSQKDHELRLCHAQWQETFNMLNNNERELSKQKLVTRDVKRVLERTLRTSNEAEFKKLETRCDALETENKQLHEILSNVQKAKETEWHKFNKEIAGLMTTIRFGGGDGGAPPVWPVYGDDLQPVEMHGRVMVHHRSFAPAPSGSKILRMPVARALSPLAFASYPNPFLGIVNTGGYLQVNPAVEAIVARRTTPVPPPEVSVSPSAMSSFSLDSEDDSGEWIIHPEAAPPPTRKPSSSEA